MYFILVLFSSTQYSQGQEEAACFYVQGYGTEDLDPQRKGMKASDYLKVSFCRFNWLLSNAGNNSQKNML